MISKLRQLAMSAVFVFAVVVFGAAGADAQTTYAGATPPVVGNVVATTGSIVGTTPAASTVQVLALQVSPPAPATAQARVGGLAFTGGDFVRLVLFALPMIALGIGLTRMARARSHQA